MKYRVNSKNGDELSVLGYGCMRFPKSEKEAERQVLYAIEQGVNYFDTAYIYPGSEVTLGKILSRNNCRKKIKLATKLPPYLVRKSADIEKLFCTQLERLQTDYIDYYLIHMLTQAGQWTRLVQLGIIDWIKEKKETGKIINLGFSYHGGQGNFKEIIDLYDWDFCMIQYNYLDENAQAGKSGLQYAAAKGIPVIIMEPLRGGRLAVKLPKEAADEFKKLSVQRSPAEWGLRWVWNHPEALTVLSGMDSIEIIEENLRAASSVMPKSLSDEELAAFDRAKKIINDKTHVPCTGCNYCMPCPQGIDIPLCFTLFNNTELESKNKARINYMSYVGSGGASKCTKCGKCEKHCPQGIKIREELANAAKMLEPFPFKQIGYFARKVMKQK